MRGCARGGVRSVRSSIRKFSYNYLQSINPELSNKTRFFKFRPFYDPVEPFEVDLFPFFVNFSRFFDHFSINFSDFRQKKLPLFRRFTHNHWLKNNSEHCVGKALFWSCEAILGFVNVDHSTTFWSRLKSTNIQIFRLFQRLLLKFTLFQICISHWICQSQLQWTLITDYLQWIRKFKSQAFTTNLFFFKPTTIQHCSAMPYKRISRHYCWNSSFFRFAILIEFVNLNSNVFKWQIIRKHIFNIQETTFFRSFLTAFFEPQTLFSGSTPLRPGKSPGLRSFTPPKSVWG